MISTLLIEMPEFREIISECENIFRDKENIISKGKIAESELQRPNSWKYSHRDYFNPLPHRNEILGFPPAKVIKKKYKNTDEASKAGIYSSGFLGDKHVITRCPVDLDNIIDLRLHEYHKESILNLSVKSYRKNLERKNDRLESVEMILTRDDAILSGGYSKVGDYSVHYLKVNDKNRIIEEYVYAKEWSTNGVYRYLYEEEQPDQLSEIRTLGKSGEFDVLIWKNKN